MIKTVVPRHLTGKATRKVVSGAVVTRVCLRHNNNDKYARIQFARVVSVRVNAQPHQSQNRRTRVANEVDRGRHACVACDSQVCPRGTGGSAYALTSSAQSG